MIDGLMTVRVVRVRKSNIAIILVAVKRLSNVMVLLVALEIRVSLGTLCRQLFVPPRKLSKLLLLCNTNFQSIRALRESYFNSVRCLGTRELHIYIHRNGVVRIDLFMPL